jgi:type IV pilus assembly protein PilB
MSTERVKRLGDMLVADGLVSALQVGAALQEQRAQKLRLGSALVQLGFLPEAKLAVYLSKLTHLPCVNPEAVEVPDDVIGLIPTDVAVEHCVFPLRVQGGTLHVAVADPLQEEMRDWLSQSTGLRVTQLVSPDVRLKNAIRRRYAVSC